LEGDYIKIFGAKIFYKIGDREVYKPSEDSLLALKYSIIFSKGICLDMGSGSGILSIFMAKKDKVKKVYASDIDEDFLLISKVNFLINRVYEKISIIKSNLFEKIPKIKFDFIAFNPPYLPKDEYVGINKKIDMWTIGGEKGIEIAKKFLKEAYNYLKPKGKILLITSSYSNIKKLLENFREYKKVVLEEVYLGNFEKLYAILLEKNEEN